MIKIFQNINYKLTASLNHQFDFSSVNRRFSLVFFTTFTAFFFLNFFEPFGLYYDKSTPAQEVFVELFIAMTIAFVVLIITQFVIKPLLNFFVSTIWAITGWFFLEAIFVAAGWTFLDFIIDAKGNTFVYLLGENLLAYVLIMILPYYLFITYIYFKDKLKLVEKNKQTIQKEITNISFKDESGETKLIIESKNLLYIKSADNYVEINYFENNIPKNTLIRNSLKNLESDLIDYPIIRCHRSFIINTKRIESAKKTTSGFDVKMQLISDLTIPVSRSYVSELKKHTVTFN
jgi:hypothetical protein